MVKGLRLSPEEHNGDPYCEAAQGIKQIWNAYQVQKNRVQSARCQSGYAQYSVALFPAN